jgi:hypothetical protein
VIQEAHVSTERDMAVIADLQTKGQAILDALEAARPAIERLRLTAVRGRSTVGVLARLAAHELGSSIDSEQTLEHVVDVAMSRDRS